MEVTRRRDSSGQFSDNSDHDCEESSLKCKECGKNRVIMARYSEGYGTEEECVQSDPQRESDADADVEDADTSMFLRVQTTGGGLSAENQLSEAKAPASNQARHYRERG
ncbi:uncharacterized protein si:ch211-63p21.1 isoform X4 [Tachysurus fulvidraco]|uniref:uncharacterized protein si:ch211-63p21.1 isoform X4 n=1 Tax=Tachysurus fulvidraco TaxID=1234273 RepID=UPI001FEE4761|nr:uncharacterized protein si:ch211-63p21.1 isoform X4 [Tachysurus fulvidraco]